jgi:hypothetical protein
VLSRTEIFSTISGHFPHKKMFLSMYFHKSSGVLSVHRKRDLPAEESRRRAITRIGNETHGASG